jgi:hypothetical protein
MHEQIHGAGGVLEHGEIDSEGWLEAGAESDKAAVKSCRREAPTARRKLACGARADARAMEREITVIPATARTPMPTPSKSWNSRTRAG